jgi:hypothetical protein
MVGATLIIQKANHPELGALKEIQVLTSNERERILKVELSGKREYNF